MTTSGNIFPQRLTEIDDLTRPQHTYLQPDDKCLFLGEYTAYAGFSFSHTNGLILNFKKPMDRQGRPEWRYKTSAIRTAAEAFRAAIDEAWLRSSTLVPIPPSKTKADPRHDDRVLQMLRLIHPQPPLDIRELIVQPQNREVAAHEGQRPGPADLAALYTIDPALAQPQPARVLLFDDLLVTGAGFKAAKSVLLNHFPGLEVFGLFIARRVPPAPEFEPVDH